MSNAPLTSLATLRLHGPGVPTQAALLSLRGDERLDSLYRLEIEFLCPAAQVDADALLYGRAAVGLPCAEGQRWVAGSIGQLQLSEGPEGTVHCRAVLEPRLGALRRRRRSRILRELSVVGLIRTLLGELGLEEEQDFVLGPELLEAEAQRPFGTRAERPRHRLMVQENETDLAFLSRWLEREGVGMSFVSDESGVERVVFFAGELPCGEVLLPAELQRHLHTTRNQLPRAVIVCSDGQREEPLQAVQPCDSRGGPEEILPDAHWRSERQARQLALQRHEELLGQATRYRASASEGVFRPGLWVRSGEHVLRVLGARYEFTRASETEGSFTLEWEAESARAPHRPVRRTPWPANANTAAALASRASAGPPAANSSGAEGLQQSSEAGAPASPAASAAGASPAPVADLSSKAPSPSPESKLGASASVSPATPTPAAPTPAAEQRPVQEHAAEPELVGALPGPGFGSPEDANEDGDDDPKTRDLDKDQDPFDLDGMLWSGWLEDYYEAQTQPTWRPHWHREHQATLIPKFQLVLPPGQPWNMFERECTSFSGGFGGHYSVRIGPTLGINLGNTGAFSEGLYAGSVANYAVSRSLSNTGAAESISNIGASMSVTTALTTNSVDTIGAANSLSNVLMSTGVDNALVRNSMSATAMSNSMSATLMENSKSDVAMSNSMSMVGMSNSMSTVGMSSEMNTVAIANSITMGAMSNSIDMVALNNSISMGESIGLRMGNDLDLALSPTATSIFLGALKTDISLCAKLDAWIGAGVSVAIGATVDCYIGAKLNVFLGYKGDFELGYAEELATMSQTTALMDKVSALMATVGI